MRTNELEKDLPSSEDLIDYIQYTNQFSWGIASFSRQKIDEWLSNFTGKALNDVKFEQQLALWLLYNFVYYNETEIRHLNKILLKKFVHQILPQKEELSNNEINDILKEYLFRPLGEISESGGYMSYLFRQESNIPLEFFKRSEDKKHEDYSYVVYIDDMTLSGKTAQGELKKDIEKYKNAKIFLLTLIASTDAIDIISKIGVDIINCITFDNRSKAFSNNSIIFSNLENYKNDCKKMCEYYGKNLAGNKNSLGFENGQFLFGLAYNTPNNTLPIFWSNKNNWRPIFSRHNKNKSEDGGIKFDGTFI